MNLATTISELCSPGHEGSSLCACVLRFFAAEELLLRLLCVRALLCWLHDQLSPPLRARRRSPRATRESATLGRGRPQRQEDVALAVAHSSFWLSVRSLKYDPGFLLLILPLKQGSQLLTSC